MKGLFSQEFLMGLKKRISLINKEEDKRKRLEASIQLREDIQSQLTDAIDDIMCLIKIKD